MTHADIVESGPMASPGHAARIGSSRPVRPVRTALRRIPVAVFIALVIIVEVLPLIWIFLSSVRPAAEFTTRPMWTIPLSFDWGNYVYAWTTGAMGTYLRNSVAAVVPSLAIIIVLSLSAAFALEVMRWRAKHGVLLLFLAGIMVPLQMILLPLFTIFVQFNLINNLFSLILTYSVFGLPLTIFMLTGFYKSVPRTIIEAAVIDGASVFGAFWRITIPMMRNSIFTVLLVQFFFIWNDLLLSLTFINDDNLRTVQTGLLTFTTGYGQQWGPTFAAVCMAILPTLVIYLVLNQRVIKGVAAGSVKG
jgi:raffinose/stachyose/melibiose transport system permease protein